MFRRRLRSKTPRVDTGFDRISRNVRQLVFPPPKRDQSPHCKRRIGVRGLREVGGRLRKKSWRKKLFVVLVMLTAER